MVLPNAFIAMDEELHALVEGIFQAPALNNGESPRQVPVEQISGAIQLINPQRPDLIETHGSSFWLRKR